jgi:hypothetical protein
MILVLLASSGLLAACGGSHSAAVAVAPAAAATATHPAVAAGASPSAARALTKAQAKAFARAVNLTAADVPGFKVSSEHHEQETPAEKRLEGELTRCAGGAARNLQVAEVSSKEFEREDKNGVQSVQSGVTVEPTAALAVKELAEARSQRGRNCFSHYLSLLFKGKKFSGASIGPISISAGSPSAPGTSGSFGWRISTTITVNRVAVPFYMDILGFVYGPTEVSLFSFGLPEPFPAATEQHLFSLLLQRAKANSI